MSNQDIRTFNLTTGTSYLTGGFDGSLKDAQTFKKVVTTFRNLSRIVPQIEDNAQWNTREVYHGCLFIHGLELMTHGSLEIMHAFVINRLCEIGKENLAPTYVKGTSRFQDNLDVFRNHGFDRVRSRLHDKVNLGAKVLDRDYPTRLNIEWLARAAKELDDLGIEFYDFKNMRLANLPEVCNLTLINRWLTITESYTDTLSAVGVQSALQEPTHLLTDSEHFGAFIEALRKLLVQLKEMIPFDNAELFNQIDDEDDEEDDGFEIEEDDQEEDDQEEDEGEDDEAEPPHQELDDLFSDEESMDETYVEEDDEDLDDEDLEDEEEDDEDDDADEGSMDEEETDEEDFDVQPTMDSYAFLCEVVPTQILNRAIIDYINTNVIGFSGGRVDRDFSDIAHLLITHELEPRELIEAVAKDVVCIDKASAYNLASVVGTIPEFEGRVLHKLREGNFLSDEVESINEAFAFEHERPESFLAQTIETIANQALSTDFVIDTHGTNRHQLYMAASCTYPIIDMNAYSYEELRDQIHKASPQSLFEGLLKMTEHLDELDRPVANDCMSGHNPVQEEVRTLTDKLLRALGMAELEANTDYRIELQDMCEALDNFELPLDPTFRAYLVTRIEEMLGEKFGKVIVTSKFDLRGVFFKFISVELDMTNTKSISILEIVTSDDFDAETPESDDDEEAASDLNYALKS